jgi:hypothetical protein
MPDSSPYQRSIETAANTLAAANADWQRISDAMAAIPAEKRETGMPGAADYKTLSEQLDAAAKRSATSEAAYQSAIEQSDKAAVTAKTVMPAGTTRDRLDTTAGNVLVTIREIADGQGGWTLDRNTPITKVDVAGATPGADSKVTAAPTSRMILVDGVLKDNPAYEPPRAATPTGAVPTSEFIYDGAGNPVKNPAYVPPKTPDEALTTGGKAVDAATAANAQASSDTALATAQTNQQIAQASLADAQRRARQSPTDEQAQAAIATAQRGLDLANQTLQQTLDTKAAQAPGDLAQQQATLASTQATTAYNQGQTDKARLGDLYGLQDKIKQIRDLIVSGQLTPDQGTQMIAAARAGTTPYDVARQQSTDALTARGQDTTNKGNLTSAYNGLIGSAGSMFADLNKNGQPGSDASGRAYLAMMGMAQDYLKSYQNAPATPTDYLGTGPNPTPSPIGNMVTQAQQQLATAPAVATVPAVAVPPATAAPPATDSSGHVITINIGGTGANGAPPATPAPVLPPGVAGTGLDPRLQPLAGYSNRTVGGAQDLYGSGPSSVSGLVRAAAQAVPGTPADVAALYPEAAARHGMQYG